MNAQILTANRAFLLTLFSLMIPSVGAQSATASPPPAQAQTAADTLSYPHQERARELGETLYNTWRLAMQRRDEQAWQKVTPRSRQQKVRNLVRSMKGKMSEDFFSEEAKSLPMLENFRFIGAIAGAQRRTMNLVYLGRLLVGEDETQTVAYVLYFIDETGKGAWTFDQSRFVSLEHLPDYATRLSKKDVEVLRDVELFHPYATVPAVPTLVGDPQLVGKVFLDIPGRAVTMKINGVSTHEFHDERRADVILGGLRRGENTINYTINDADGAPRDSFAIGLFVMPEKEGNQPAVVFEHILDAKDKAKGGSFTFYIGNSHLASMDPNYKGPRSAPFRPVPLKEKK